MGPDRSGSPSLHVPDSKLRLYEAFLLPTQSEYALRWLEEHAEGEYVFPADGATVMPYLTDLRPGMKAAGLAIGAHVSPHDFRRNHVDVQDGLMIDTLI